MSNVPEALEAWQRAELKAAGSGDPADRQEAQRRLYALRDARQAADADNRVRKYRGKAG